MDRAALKEYILKQYNVEPDCPWPKHPNFEVFRHAGNQKWFALAMEVPKEKLGLRENGTLDVVNFKCDEKRAGDFSRLSYEQRKMVDGGAGCPCAGRYDKTAACNEL